MAKLQSLLSILQATSVAYSQSHSQDALGKANACGCPSFLGALIRVAALMVLLQQAQITQRPVACRGRGDSKCSQAVPLLSGLAPFCSHQHQGSCKSSSTTFINQKQELGSFSKVPVYKIVKNLTFELLFVDLCLIWRPCKAVHVSLVSFGVCSLLWEAHPGPCV